MDELMTKTELIQSLRKRDKNNAKARKGAVATAMLAAGSAMAKNAKRPVTAAATAIATIPALAYTMSKAHKAKKYEKVIKNNKDLYKLDQLEYGQLNYR